MNLEHPPTFGDNLLFHTWNSEKNETRRHFVFGSRVVAEAGLPTLLRKDWRTWLGELNKINDTLPKNSGREIKPSKTQIDGLENIITPHNTLSEHHIQHCQASYNIPLHTNLNLDNRDYQQVPPRDTL